MMCFQRRSRLNWIENVGDKQRDHNMDIVQHIIARVPLWQGAPSVDVERIGG